MNLNNLNKLIDCYEDNLKLIYAENDEFFKWRAVQAFQKEFVDEKDNGKSFLEKFVQAKKELSVLMDNSMMSPSSGIVKLAEQDENAVSKLFENLLSDDNGNLTERQNNMDAFGDGVEKLLAKYYPQSWKYKQDRHSVSCYLSLFRPDENYIYRYTEAERFARFTEFEKDIGSGGSFRLDVYYEMCDKIKEVLKTHPSLLEKQKSFINANDDLFRDEEYHLLVFNLIWCSSTYNFFRGLDCRSRKEVLRDFNLEQLNEKIRLQKESEKNALIEQIEELEYSVEYCKEISLLGVQVTDSKTGEKGTVIGQNVNMIKVLFGKTERSFAISKAYPARPRFEDDEKIVEMFTEYEETNKKIKTLKNELQRLGN